MTEHEHRFTVAVEWEYGYIGRERDAVGRLAPTDTFFWGGSGVALSPAKRRVTVLRCESCDAEVRR